MKTQQNAVRIQLTTKEAEALSIVLNGISVETINEIITEPELAFEVYDVLDNLNKAIAFSRAA